MAVRMPHGDDYRRLSVGVRHVRCGLLAACVLSLGASVLAGTGGVIRLPTGNTKPRSGLKVVIDHRWLDGNGYRPVRVEVINWPPGPTKADRTICVVLQPNSYYRTNLNHRVTQYIELPQGASRASATISIPQCNTWQQIDVSVYEDGQLCEDLSRIAQTSANSNDWSEANPAILIVDSDAPSFDDRQGMLNVGRPPGQAGTRQLPDIRFLSQFFPTTSSSSRGIPIPDDEIEDGLTIAELDALSNVELLPPSELPDRWIDYTCCDMIFIPFADLKTLARQHSRRWEAIRAWLRSGRMLCVYDMDLSQKQLDQLSLLLDVPAAESDDGQAPLSAWQRPKDKNADESIRALEEAYEYYARYRQDRGEPELSLEEIKAALESRTEQPQPPESVPFLYRRVQLGYVAAIRTAEPFQPGKYGMSWLQNELGSDKWMWYQRHGMSLHRRNSAYWDWMIPGVGSAPVGLYLLLISVFVIVMGPLNYFFLRRKKRLYMLLVTVPLGAGVVTAALLNYALVTDGLAVRTRVRSYTQIDQRTGVVESWSRQTYYAGLAPSSGLSYPDDTAVYPILHCPTDRSHHETPRQLYWDGDQNLTAGYLGSRSTMQLMVVRSAATRRGLSVVAADDENAAPLVTNRLDARIIQLFVTDRAGHHYGASDIQPGQLFRPRRIVRPEALARIRALTDAARPAFPAGYGGRGFGGGASFSGYYWSGWTDVDPSMSAPGFNLGILERNIDMSQSGSSVGWLPGGYVAITETSPEAPIGYAASREEASFHMIVGQW